MFLLAIAVVATLAAQVVVLSGRTVPSTEPDAAAPAAPQPDPVAPRPAAPTEASRPSPDPAPRPDAPRGIRAFRGLGVWVDLFDFDALEPADVIATMKRNGARTLYIQTGRHNTAQAVAPEVGPWTVAAHDAGLDVIGWYLPSYKRVAKDVRRAVAAAEWEYEGHRLDGIGIDIEYKAEVRHVPTWNERVVTHMRRVRSLLPDGYPLASIVPPPLQMDVAPLRWAGFPWRGIAKHSDVMMLMSYWSYRNCPEIPDHCAGPFTSKNITLTRELTRRPDLPIHTIGGVADRVSKAEIRAFVEGARSADAFGASIYDYRTTRAAFWPWLAKLGSL